MFDNKNNNILQFNIILNNEVVMLESFIQIFDMMGMYFSEFLTSIFSKNNKLPSA
jgi:hypothetical protein